MPAVSIGFVLYHCGVPVNDFRYLAAESTVDLDWSDPWYSRFRHPNLRRQFDAPLSAYLYIEPYEVRKEIIVRPRDLQQWLDLGLRHDGIIPVSKIAKEMIDPSCNCIMFPANDHIIEAVGILEASIDGIDIFTTGDIDKAIASLIDAKVQFAIDNKES